MIINILTPDSKKPNLAAMKISAWHKANGDDVMLNFQLRKADFTYASILFEWTPDPIADLIGGSKYPESQLPPEFEKMIPDYDLFGIDYSMGYTFRPCFNSCDFCKVPKMNHPDIEHHSICEFHNPEFKKICLLNNNTFQDSRWKDTFAEIWDLGLSVIDVSGYDLRLLDDERADALHKTKWSSSLHFAWDRMTDEPLIVRGLSLLKKHKLASTSNGVYVIIGHNTTEEEDLYRCQIVDDFGLTPYPMPYRRTKKLMRFKRFVNLHYYRSYKTIAEAWKDYKK